MDDAIVSGVAGLSLDGSMTETQTIQVIPSAELRTEKFSTLPSVEVPANIIVNTVKTTDVEKLYIWLYSGCNILPLKDLVRLGKRCNIPPNIVLSKFIIQLMNDNLNIDAIIEKLIEHEILQDFRIEIVKDLINELEIYKGAKLLTPGIFKILTSLAAKVEIENTLHSSDYPRVDEERGRPYLNWKECYYDDCHLQFKSPEQLMNHLIKAGKYTARFHLQHELAVKWLNLSPEKVTEEKFTRCPSHICNKSNHIFTPEELCEHFKELGISPFWIPGARIHKTEAPITLDDKCYNKIYADEDCSVCLNAQTSAILLPCYHNSTCLVCSSKIGKCPICRSIIIRVIPF
ncbi:Hypothetical protein HVR_LOCUS834 [uncultured virus]|nr:Hypothetical protein HVR_LOCUS834 [uncultured virus]